MLLVPIATSHRPKLSLSAPLPEIRSAVQGHADRQVRFILLHDHRNDDGIRQFFLEVWELWVKVGPSVLLLVILCSLSISIPLSSFAAVLCVLCVL